MRGKYNETMKKENKNSPEADTLKLIHELEAHRIELKMQNGEMHNEELERFNDLTVGRELKMNWPTENVQRKG